MVTLDWRDPSHWGGGWDTAWSLPKGQQGSAYHGRWLPGTDRRARCRLCGRATFLRDDAGRPAHKVCVEAAIDAASAQWLAGWSRGREAAG